jgi:hypothetical protein
MYCGGMTGGDIPDSILPPPPALGAEIVTRNLFTMKKTMTIKKRIPRIDARSTGQHTASVFADDATDRPADTGSYPAGRKYHLPKEKPIMNYRLKIYGDDVLIELTETDKGRVQEIKDSLPTEVRDRIIGYRLVAAMAICP